MQRKYQKLVVMYSKKLMPRNAHFMYQWKLMMLTGSLTLVTLRT